MIHSCNKCHEPKELNTLNYKTLRVKGKLYFEKTCKSCRNQAANVRAKERYKKDSHFKQTKLAKNERNRIIHQINQTPVWIKKTNATKKWKSLNKERIRAKESKRHKFRWSNPTYRVSKCMSNYLNKHIRDKNYENWCVLVGYSVGDLMKHIESQFQEGMSWENYGQWHIDHIRPVCSFSFASKYDEEFKKCWALSNLRPLWKYDNLKKSADDKTWHENCS